jgi:hypothetical protein
LPEKKLTFVHVSDIHFIRGFSGESAFDLDEAVRKAILEDAKHLRRTIGSVQGILITGDIAFAGKSAEYQTALNWLAQLAEQLECEKEYVWCVPGNHEVDQSVLKENTAISALHDRLRRSEHVDKQLKDDVENENTGRLLFAPLKAYNEEFATRFNCLTQPKQPWWEDDMLLNDGSILRLRGLNSVLISGPNDDNKENKLLLGSAQTECGRDNGVEYLILCHHPVDWLLDGENAQQALMAYSRIQLFGHKHIQKVNQMDDTLWLVAGAVHPFRAERNWVPRYNCLSLEVEGTGNDRRLSVDVYARVWSQIERLFTREQGSYKEEFRNYKLRLREWQPAMVPEAPTAVAPAEAKYRPPEKQEVVGMNLNKKKLLYRFIGLPHHTRIAIMKKFDLLQEGDEKRPDAEVFATCFERAKTKGVLDAVWDAVEAQPSHRS